MTEWHRTTLGEVVRLEYGKPLPEKVRDGKGAPVLGSNGIVGYHSEALVAGPGIVVGRKGTAGSVTFIADDFFPIDTTYFVTVTDKVANMRFAELLLQHADLPAICAQTGVPGLNRDRAYELSISLPSVPEQRRIADLVGMMDNLLAVLRREGDARSTASLSALDAVIDSTTKGASMAALEDLLAAKATYGVLKPGDAPMDGVPLIRGQDIANGGVVIPQVRNISKDLDAQYARSRVAAGDVVMVLVGTPGATGIVPPGLDGANISRAVGRLRPDLGRVTSEYLVAVLTASRGRSRLQAQVRGAVQQMINLKELRAVQIPVPSSEVQALIASVFIAGVEANASAARELSVATAVRSRLLAGLMSGEMAVPSTYDRFLNPVSAS